MEAWHVHVLRAMMIVPILRLLYLVDPSYALLPHDGGEGVPRAAVHGQAARHLLPILQQPLHLQQEQQQRRRGDVRHTAEA